MYMYLSLVLHLRVAEATSEHAQCLDWEDEFVVWVRDHAAKVVSKLNVHVRYEGSSVTQECAKATV